MINFRQFLRAMWRVFLLISFLCLWTKTNGLQRPKDPPPQIVDFYAHDRVNPGQVKGFRPDSGFDLPCKATGNNLKWKWTFNGGALPQWTVRIINDTLVGRNLGVSESGTYQCFVEDTESGVQTFSRELKVKVTAVGDFANRDPKVERVNLGDSFSFDCPQHAPSYGIGYSWEGVKDNVQFERDERRAISPTGTLFITSITQEDITKVKDHGGILCEISAVNTYYESGPLTLELKGNKPVRGPTTWGTTPDSEEVAVEGRRKELYCIAFGNPAPKITWKKNGVKLVPDENFEIPKVFFNRLLNISKAKKDLHEDNYSCEAEVDGVAVLSKTFSLRVQVFPKWTTAPPKSKISIGINGNGTIECDVTADPPASYSWYRNGREISSPISSDEKIRVERNKLHFKDVTLEEDGIYQCVAKNTIGMIVSSTWVNIMTQSPSFEKNGFGPFFLFEGSVGRLKCTPEAAPRPTRFEWYKGNKLLTGSGYIVEQDGTLVIDKVDEDDAASYKCYAENFLGNATAKANATVFAKTRIIIPPKSKKVDIAARLDLRCEAEADERLELGYYWMKDDARLIYDEKIEWRESQNVLTIADMTFYDSGNYTCVAFTPEPEKSRDSASAIIDIAGVPDPPINLMLSSTCLNRTTTLSWETGSANGAPISHFLIEQRASFANFTEADSAFQVIANVTKPNALSFSLDLAGAATLEFRMRAVNRFGPSRASLPTSRLCRTEGGVPDKWPDNLRGVGEKPNTLDITWTPMPRIDWNAPGLYYKLFYRKVSDSDKTMKDAKIDDPAMGTFKVQDPGYHQKWEFSIQAGNYEGLGEISPLVEAYSGQDPPNRRPEDVTVGAVTARSIELSWKPVTVDRPEGSVDGYKIYYWSEILFNAKRRRRDIPSYALSIYIEGGDMQTHIVTNLMPYRSYTMVIRAVNNGGEGPPSVEVFAKTLEAEPGPPSKVKVYAFAKYILVTWEPPLEPNGIIKNYQVGSKSFIDSGPEGVAVEMQPTGIDTRRKLLENQEPERDYVVEIQAQTSKGWGSSVRTITRTVKWSAPAKPNRPTVEGIAVDGVRVDYKFGLGGGYTHEFMVMYRSKVEGETFQNTSWVNHFETQSVDIGNLSPDLHEFKTVARNDFPDQANPEESPASDVTEGRPLPGVVNAGIREETPVHRTAWFVTLMILIVLVIIGAVIIVLYNRHQGTKYPVGKREKERAALIYQEPLDELEGAPNNARSEHPPPYKSDSSLHRDSDRDSLDDYGEGKFNEDGSFIQEYGDEKNEAHGEKDHSAFSTFV